MGHSEMHLIKQKIKDLRPGLREVAPLTFYICIGFGVLNLVLGYSLITTHDSSGLVIVHQYTPLWAYGVLFMVLGAFGLAVIARNNWKWIRRTLVIGLLYKTIWFYALFYSLFHGGSLAIFGLWLFLIHIQAVTYIYFVPAAGDIENGRPTSV